MQDPKTFLATGQIPATSRQRGELLDRLRNEILSQTIPTKNQTNMPSEYSIEEIQNMITAGRQARAKLVKPSTATREHAAAWERQNGLKPGSVYPQAQPARPAPAKPAPAASNKFSAMNDASIIQAATHRCSPPADKAAALAEANKRGIIINKGIAAKSIKRA